MIASSPSSPAKRSSVHVTVNQFSNIALGYKHKLYSIDAIKQSACLAVEPIAVDHFAYFFNCTRVGRGSDSLMATT